MQASGLRGEVRCGHRVAARLGAWSLSRTGVLDDRNPSDQWAATGEVTERDDYLLEFGSRFDLVLEFGGGEWLWRGVSLTDEGGLITLRGKGDADKL